MCTPTHERLAGRIVIGEVMLRDFGIQPTPFIAYIFCLESVAVVFGMTEYKNLTAVFGFDDVYARLVRDGEEMQQGIFANIFLRTSVWRECGAKKTSLKPRNRFSFGVSTLCSKTPLIFSGSSYFGMP